MHAALRLRGCERRRAHRAACPPLLERDEVVVTVTLHAAFSAAVGAAAAAAAPREAFSSPHAACKGAPQPPTFFLLPSRLARPSSPEDQLTPTCLPSRTLSQRVHSFDLVAAAPHVTACNMAHVPLGNAVVDAAVFSLALMGTDYGLFLQEAARVVRHKGYLWIAEVRQCGQQQRLVYSKSGCPVGTCWTGQLGLCRALLPGMALTCFAASMVSPCGAQLLPAARDLRPLLHLTPPPPL